MVTLIRYTSQKQQELRSRHQLSERFVEFGWIPVAPEDLGEDFVVNIYFDGRATGVNFYVQLKSITNLHERRRQDYLPYSFEVKDLLHWEQFSYPVVLVVWDVELRDGRWAMLHDVIKELDKHNPNWRTQKTKTVHLPWQNTTENKGLIKLRLQIGQKLYPLISKGKSFTAKVEIQFDMNTSSAIDIIIPLHPNHAPDPNYLKLIEQLNFIHEMTGQWLEISAEGFSPKDIRSVRELIAIIQQGRIELYDQEVTFTIKFNNEDFNLLNTLLTIHKQGGRIEGIKVSTPTSYVELLDTKIELGHMERFISGRLKLPYDELKEIVDSLTTNQTFKLELTGVTNIEIFPDWFTREAKRISNILADKFDATEVYLFGSLVWSKQFTPDTDIDLAVGGLSNEKFFKAIGYLEQETPYPFDIVSLDDVQESLRHRILTEGDLLYEREPVAVN